MNGYLNADTLTNLAFERSKFWSTMLEKFSKIDDGEELALDLVEDVFDENKDEAYISISHKEAKEVDINEDEEFLEEITNLSLMKNNQTVINNEQHHELCEILNETLPILNEHSRQLKANGVEKILNTFDARKIEETVGGWMQKQNSKMKKHNLKNNNNYLKNYNKKSEIIYHEDDENEIDNEDAVGDVNENEDAEQDEDADGDDDSFESIDEANYIRKCKESSLPSGNNKLKNKINKNMKNNCKIKKIRKDMLVRSNQSGLEDHDYYLKYILLKSQISHSQVDLNSEYKTSFGLSKKSLKIVRKHYPKKLSIDRPDTESDDSNSFEDKNVKRLRKKTAYKRNYNYRRDHSMSSPSTSFDNNSSYRSILNHSSGKKYVTDSSMSDWMVEECSPKKMHSNSNLVSNKAFKNSVHMQTPERSLPEKKIRKCRQLEVKSKKSLNEEEKEVIKTSSDEDFEEQLKLAIKESKKQYQKELKSKLYKNKTRSSIKQMDCKKSISDIKAKAKLDFDSTIMKSVSEKSMKNKMNISESNISSIKKNNLIGHNTFLNDSRGIVNSTALPNHSFALQKQFEKFIKNDITTTTTTAATATTITATAATTPTSPVSSTVPDNPENKYSSVENVRTPIRKAHDSSPVSSTSDLNKGIVIYTPKCDSIVKSKNSSYFSVTKEHLKSVIGEAKAEKFFKYYVGRRIFNGNSTVYYKPPENNYLRLKMNNSADNSSQNENTGNTTDEEDDILENFGKYGELYESIHTD